MSRELIYNMRVHARGYRGKSDGRPLFHFCVERIGIKYIYGENHGARLLYDDVKNTYIRPKCNDEISRRLSLSHFLEMLRNA